MKHSPKPWRFFGSTSVVDANGSKVCEVSQFVLDSIGHGVCTISPKEKLLRDQREIGRYIVQACNHFWEVVEAAKNALEKYRNMTAHEFACGADIDVRTRLVLAIAKAEGKKFK